MQSYQKQEWESAVSATCREMRLRLIASGPVGGRGCIDTIKRLCIDFQQPVTLECLYAMQIENLPCKNIGKISNILADANIETVAEYLKLSREQLLAIRQIGQISIDDLNQAILTIKSKIGEK